MRVLTHYSTITNSPLRLSAALSAVLLVGCGGPADTQDDIAATSPVEGVDAAPVVKIATESSYKPMSYTDANGELIGFEIDLMNALCEQMNAQCDISSQEWEGLIPGLQAKKFDAVIAGMSITPERLEVVNFSDPYFNSGLIFIAKKDNDISLASDLSGMAIGAQRSTVSSEYLEDNHPSADVKLYDTQENAYLDLTSGRTQAILSDKVTGLDWLNTPAGADYEVKGDEISTEGDAMGIALRQEDPLVDDFNAALEVLKQNGTYAAIAKPYFGDMAFATPTTNTAAKVDPTMNVVEGVGDGSDMETVTVIEGTKEEIDGVDMVRAEETM